MPKGKGYWLSRLFHATTIVDEKSSENFGTENSTSLELGGGGGGGGQIASNYWTINTCLLIPG